MLTPGRQFEATNSYRYGFSGKENDNAVKGEGNSLDFGDRVYDPRIARWMSIDPLQSKFPSLTPYNYCYNSPLEVIDPDGKLGISVQVQYNKQTGRYTIIKIEITDDLVSTPAERPSIGANWYDYIRIYDNPTGDPSLKNADLVPIVDKKLTFRTRTTPEWKWWAKALVNDGIYEDYGGIMWTSEEGKGEESKRGRPAFMSNIDVLLAATSTDEKQLLEFKGAETGIQNIQDFVEKLAQIVNMVSDQKPGDKLNLDDPAVIKTLAEMEKLLAAYDGKQEVKKDAVPMAKQVDVYLKGATKKNRQTGWQVNPGGGIPDTTFWVPETESKKKEARHEKQPNKKKG